MNYDAVLVGRLERLEKKFPGLCAELKRERLEVATLEELTRIRATVDSIESIVRAQFHALGALTQKTSKDPAAEG